MELHEIHSMILKDGIRKFKYKNSKIKPISYKPEGNKGAIFVFRSKEQMIDARGVVFTSEEALLFNEDQFTHWTPNVYSYGTYADAAKQITKGHSEKNLRQINTFVVDIDVPQTDNLSEMDIINACCNVDFGFLPTFILKTPGGYQAYFVLDKPWFISNADNYASLKLARNVSNSIRKYFAQTLPVDLGCNHFGIARIPRTDNIVDLNESCTYDMQSLIDWSIKHYSKKKAKANKEKLARKAALRVYPSQKNGQVSQPWVKMLLRNDGIRGNKGLLGRNNAIFTLALAHYSSAVSYEDCYDILDEFNSNLSDPIDQIEFDRTLNSAYSGNYKGAKRTKIRELIENWIPGTYTDAQLFGNFWYKFKKARKDRKNSHYDEWKEDLRVYLNANSTTQWAYIQTSKQAIVDEIGIPKRSLDHCLKEMKAAGEIYFKSKRGFGGGIVVATRVALFGMIIKAKKEHREKYLEVLRRKLPEAVDTVVAALNPSEIAIEKTAVQLHLQIANSS